MEKNNLKIQLEELGVEDSVAEDIIAKVNSGDKISLTSDHVKSLQETDLKNKINETKDWRKRASLAARIISLNLE